MKAFNKLWSILWSMAFLLTPIVVLSTSLSAIAREKEAGSRALPGAHRTLADLLEQADSETAPAAPAPPIPPNAERPRAFQAPAPQPDMNLSELQRLIDERNRIIDDSRLFTTIKNIVREEQTLTAIGDQVRQAERILNSAIADENLLNAPGTQDVAEGVKAAARQRVLAARSQVQSFVRKYRDQEATLRPLYERVGPHIGPWAKTYQQMTRFVIPRRSNRNRADVLDLLEAAIRQRDDFCEGHVLASIRTAYDGDFKAAQEHLDKAIAFIDEHQPALYPTHMTHDCAIAAVLAEAPQRVKNFVTMLKKLPAGRQSIAQQWLIASYSVSTKAESTASDYFRRAIAKAGGFTADEKLGVKRLPAFLAGDAAHFWLTKKEVKETDIDRATQALERAEDSGGWQLARAQAALAARQGRWEEAIQRLELCRAECPATIESDVEEELAAYKKQTLWSRITAIPPRTPSRRLMAVATQQQ